MSVGLDAVPVLACLFPTDSLNELTQTLWTTLPHRWDTLGPNPNGKLEIKSFDLDFAELNLVKLAIHASYQGSIDFTRPTRFPG